MKQLGIIHLQKHSRDLTGKFWLGVVDERVQALSDHILLLLGRSTGKCCWSKLLIGCRHGLCRRRLLHSWTLWRRRTTSVTCLLVEFDGRLTRHSTSTRSTPTGTTRSSSAGSTSRSTSARSTTARLGRHHAIAWHRISTWSSGLA